MYEYARKYVFSVHAYQQLQADTCYLFYVCFGKDGTEWFDILPMQIDDSTPIYSGLFNEVISSCLVRYLPARKSGEQIEESKEEAKGDDMSQIGKAPELPQGLDEALLVTMT